MKSEVETIGVVVRSALERAFQNHRSLGLQGLERVKKNEFGDTALRADVEAEAAVLAVLQELSVPIRVVSEEHGLVDIGSSPTFLGVLDGLDGTDVYRNDPEHGRCGTMFGIFRGTNPRYRDYVASGVMEYPGGRLFLAVKGKGAFVVEARRISPIHTSARTTLEEEVTRIYIDNFGINGDFFERKLREFKPKDRPFSAISSAVHYVDVANGSADLALECTRKGNLEIAVAYGLVVEAGGVIVDKDGEGIGPQQYLQFGQKEQVPIITAATLELAKALLLYLA